MLTGRYLIFNKLEVAILEYFVTVYYIVIVVNNIIKIFGLECVVISQLLIGMCSEVILVNISQYLSQTQILEQFIWLKRGNSISKIAHIHPV